jgi:hypothetical protein
MKQAIWGMVLILLVASALAASLSSEHRQLIRECKSGCRLSYSGAIGSCNDDYKACSTLCHSGYDSCRLEHKTTYEQCELECAITHDPKQESLTRKEAYEVRRELNRCNYQCARTYVQGKRACSISDCRRQCATEKRDCVTGARDDYKGCCQACDESGFDHITCQDGAYTAGTVLLRGCDTCTCGYDGELNCKESPTCNYDVSITEEECTGGLFQPLCAGPYFRLRCSREKYCLCGGDAGYTCPENSVCLHEFKAKIPPTLKGYRDKLGQPLGDIGICGKRPETCGNGICENIVCDDCPQPESQVTCPEDCE